MELMPKIKLFQDVDKLIDILSTNEIRGFRPWRFDGYKWISFSDYYVFGSQNSGSNFTNNLAYYISSDVAEFAQELKIVLNINNPEERKGALDTFVRITLKTFSVLDLLSPKNMLTSITLEKEFEYEEEEYYASLKILKTSIYSLSLLIKSK